MIPINYRCFPSINPNVIGFICTNLANELGHHLVRQLCLVFQVTKSSNNAYVQLLNNSVIVMFRSRLKIPQRCFQSISFRCHQTWLAVFVHIKNPHMSCGDFPAFGTLEARVFRHILDPSHVTTRPVGGGGDPFFWSLRSWRPPQRSEVGVWKHQVLVASWMFISEKWGVSINGGIQNGWFIRENPARMDDLGVPLFQETTKWLHDWPSNQELPCGFLTGNPR